VFGHDVDHLLEQLLVMGFILVASVNLNWKLLTFPHLEGFQDLGC
jgi:hypothetical protein